MVSTFISDYPQLIVIFIHSLFVLIVGLFSLYIRSIKKHIEEHIAREETAIWPKVEKQFKDIEDDFRAFELHTIEEIALLKGDVESLDKKIPNGDIKEIKAMLQMLVKR